MHRRRLGDGDPSPIIINDSSSTGERGNGIRISHPALLHGNGFRVFDPNATVTSIQADDGSNVTNLVVPWIVILNRGTAGAPLVTLYSTDNHTVNIQLDEVDFDITTFDHTENGKEHHHPALTSDSYDIISVSLLNGITPGAKVENQVISTGGARINFAKD